MTRRVRARLLLRDLSAAAAFLSIALSGRVPVPAMAVFGLALFVALFNRRPLARVPVASVITLIILALALFGAAFRGILDLVVAACTFAGLVTSHRLLSTPDTATDHQVHLTSLLTLAGGAALSGELWFGACLIVFALLASLSQGLLVLDGPTGSADMTDLSPAVKRLLLGVSLALVGGIAFFILFPRLSWNLAGQRSTPSVLGSVSGMTDRVRLGEGGGIKTSARIVARVKIEPDPGTDSLETYFHGRAFDRFDGREWSSTRKAGRTNSDILLLEVRGRVRRQDIELLPAYESKTAIALDRPAQFHQLSGFTNTGPVRGVFTNVPGDEVRLNAPGSAFKYQAVSLDPGTLPVAPDLEDRERYLDLPQALDPQIRALATQQTLPDDSALVAAQKLTSFLKNRYEYTLDQEPSDDPLRDFLFQTRRGHCEHFATALAVLLRSLGHPTRVVGGFFGGERIGEAYVLRGGDAHAWTQVFVDGRGWVAFDATPDSGRPSASSRLIAAVLGLYERIDGFWRRRVIDYSILDQVELARALVRPPDSELTQGGRRDLLPSKQAVGAAALVGLAVFGVFFVVTRLADRRKPRARATAFLDRLERALDSSGIQRRPDELIEEVASRLERDRHAVGPAVRRATQRYLEARFANAPLPPEEAAALLQALRTTTR